MHRLYLLSSLLITLAIIKALATECRRDIALLSSALLASVNATLSALSADLEVAARAGSVVRFHKLRPTRMNLDGMHSSLRGQHIPTGISSGWTSMSHKNTCHV